MVVDCLKRLFFFFFAAVDNLSQLWKMLLDDMLIVVNIQYKTSTIFIKNIHKEF